MNPYPKAPPSKRRVSKHTTSKATKERRELVKRADYLCKILAERRDGGVSAKSGLPAGPNNPLQACHILAKGHHHPLRWTLENIVTLRYSEHRYWAHTDPVAFVDWVEAKYPGRLERLRISERMARKVDLKELLIVLEAECAGWGSATMSETITLKKVAGVDISIHLEDDGTLAIKSSLSREQTMATVPLLFPSWLFEGKEIRRVTINDEEVAAGGNRQEPQP